MARPNKYNLHYFPLDVNFFDDHKILLIEEDCGVKGGYLAIRLLAMVYEQGYYLEWKDGFEVSCAKRVGNNYNGALVLEILKSCLKHGLFSKQMFERDKILTSHGIQKRWLEVMTLLRRKVEIPSAFSLVSSEETPVNSEETTPPTTLSTQKEIKLKEIKLEEKKVGMAAEPPTPTPVVVPERKKREVFSKPSLDEVKNYFAQTIGNPKNHDYWPPDKCQLESLGFFNHYEANGWVQGRGKPIKDWQAAVRNWILNAKKGSFSLPQPTVSYQPKSIPQAQTRNEPALPQLTKMQQEINYLYERFLEDKCTVVSIEHLQYNYLKQIGAINFSQQTIDQIKLDATKHLQEKNIENPNEAILMTAMKKFGVLEFFKEMQAAGRNEIFTL